MERISKFPGESGTLQCARGSPAASARAAALIIGSMTNPATLVTLMVRFPALNIFHDQLQGHIEKRTTPVGLTTLIEFMTYVTNHCEVHTEMGGCGGLLKSRNSSRSNASRMTAGTPRPPAGGGERCVLYV